MPDKKTLILLLTILSLGSTYTKAQVVFQSINDVWAYADKHNITIRTSQFDLNKSEYSKKMHLVHYFHKFLLMELQPTILHYKQH